MIVEALKYAAARLRGQSDRHGHLAEAIAMQARHRRQHRAWQPHLDNSRAFCLAAAAACPTGRTRTALVAGSGLLLDVPLDELCDRFDTVILADLAFLPGVCARAKALGKVRLLRLDLTGCLDKLGELARLLAEVEPGQLAARLPQPPELDAKTLGCPELADLDFVYSANMLSQLPLFLLPGLARQAPHLGEASLDNIPRMLIDSHLRWLSALPCPACLVTDAEEHATPRNGGPVVVTDVLHGAVLPHTAGARHWTWDFAPGGEAVSGMDVRRTVHGIMDMRAVRHRQETVA